MRSLVVVPFVLAAAGALAQFDGPAPVAWRWFPSSGGAASGSPLVNGDTVYLAAGSRIYAIDRASGNLKWRFPSVEPIPGIFRTAPIMANGVLVGVGDNKIIYGVDPETGDKKWSYAMPGSPFGQPVVAGQAVVVAQSNNKLVAVDPTTGKSIWNDGDGNPAAYNILDGLQGQIAGYGSDVLLFNTRNELVALSVVTRQFEWPRPVRFSQLPANAQPVVFGDTAYVVSGPYLVAVNPTSGTPIWERPTGMQLAFSPAPSAQGILVVSQDGDAMVYNLSDGNPASGMIDKNGVVKPVHLGSFPAQRPSAAGTKFVIPTTSGAIDLLDPTNGTIVWSYVVRPTPDEMAADAQNRNGPGGLGSKGGGNVIGGGGPNGGGQIQNKRDTPVTELEASGPAVLAGQTLLVPAKDGSLLAFDKDLGIDLTPPSVKMLFPTPGDQVSGLPPLLLYFKLEDEASGVNEKTLAITIDGKPYEATYKRDGSATVTFSMSSKTNKPLADGRHDVLVTVADWMGNTAQTHFAITIDNTLPAVVLPGQPTNPQGGFGGPGGGGKGGGFGGGGFGGGGGGGGK